MAGASMAYNTIDIVLFGARHVGGFNCTKCTVTRILLPIANVRNVSFGRGDNIDDLPPLSLAQLQGVLHMLCVPPLLLPLQSTRHHPRAAFARGGLP